MTKQQTLYPGWSWGDLGLTSAPYLLAFGSDLGAPQTATEALAQLLLDGEIEVGPRASNRTIEFTVYVEGESLLDLANAEAALALEADKPRNLLIYSPGDGSPATVYETFRAQMTFTRDDTAEQNTWRAYTISMKAAPHGRSLSDVTSPAIDSDNGNVTPTVTTISAADSLTGWTRTPTSTGLADEGNNLRLSQSSPASTAIYTPPSPINLSATRFVSALVWLQVGPPSIYMSKAPTLLVNNVAAELVRVEATDQPAINRYYWRVPANTSASTFGLRGNDANNAIRFRDLSRQDSMASPGTTRQRQRTVSVAGSARTQGSLAVEHETSSLGSTLVYTWPTSLAAGYMPALRARRVSGGTEISDPALVSGAKDNLGVFLSYSIPVAAVIPGTHLLMARVRSDTNGDQAINFSAFTRAGGADVSTTSGTRTISFGNSPTVWRNVVLARLVLPTTSVPANSSGSVRVALIAPGASNIDLDEAWLFNTSVGDLSWVECGSGSAAPNGSSNRLWIDSATIASPAPRIYRGFSADRSDAYYPNADIQSFGVHEFIPPLVNIFSVTSNAQDAKVTLVHSPRWQTHAAS